MMPMWKKITVSLAVVLAMSWFLAAIGLAEPLPPAEVVNHTTQECGQIWQGDECQSCVPADGWEFLTGSCPAGYTVLKSEAPKNCSLSASFYCCHTGHGEWSGCAPFREHNPPVPLWAILAGVTVAGAGLLGWAKRQESHERA